MARLETFNCRCFTLASKAIAAERQSSGGRAAAHNVDSIFQVEKDAIPRSPATNC